MPELRKDPITSRWVIVAEDRAARPNDFEHLGVSPTDRECPFCPGNEVMTPHELAAVGPADRAPNEPGWRVRVVPNKFPALIENDDPVGDPSSGLYQRMPGVGAHEVIVETPEHVASTSHLSPEHLGEILWTYGRRLIAHRDQGRWPYGMIFKNVGLAAGASLEHAHGQLIVLPIVPITVVEEMAGSAAHFQATNRCLYCELIRREEADESRVVASTDRFVAFCPFASRFPYETWILPRAHASHYEQLDRPTADAAARMLQGVIARLETLIERPAYNYLLHTAPLDASALSHYHWHIEVTPRLTKSAGFEWGTGFHINPLSPEQAAARLRG